MSKDIIVKEEILEDEKDLDCFGNYDKREINTCLKCGLKLECKESTIKLKKELGSIRSLTEDKISNSKKSLENNNEVAKLMNIVKNKQKEVEKKMAEKDVVKKVKKVEKSEKVVKSDKKDVSSEKTGKKGRPKSKDDVEVIEGTTVPVAFKTLWKEVKSLGDVVAKASVTNIKGSNGIIFCFPVTGRSASKVDIFLNRSAGYKISAKNVEVKETKKGPIVLAVSDDKKSQEEAAVILKKWAEDYEKHSASAPRKPKAEKDEAPAKSVKKSAKPEETKSDKTSKKVVKAGDSTVTESKKSPPVVKPVKKVEVEDDEG